MVSTPKANSDQRTKFIEAARKLGTDESEAAFDGALRKVTSAKPAPVHKPKKDRLAKRNVPKRHRDNG